MSPHKYIYRKIDSEEQILIPQRQTFQSNNQGRKLEVKLNHLKWIEKTEMLPHRSFNNVFLSMCECPHIFLNFPDCYLQLFRIPKYQCLDITQIIAFFSLLFNNLALNELWFRDKDAPRIMIGRTQESCSLSSIVRSHTGLPRFAEIRSILLKWIRSLDAADYSRFEF